MSQSSIAMLVSIKQGQEDQFREVLENLAPERGGHVSIDFAKGNRTHFARFVILDDPDKGFNRKRLLFAAIYDGNLASYLEDIKKNTSNMDAFWGFCEGYTDANNFHQFIESHNNEANTFLRAFANETVVTIREKLELRDKLNKMFDVPLREYQNLIDQLPKHRFSWVTQQIFVTTFINILCSIPIKFVQILRLIFLLRYGINLARAFYLVAIRLLIPQPPIDQQYSAAPLKKGVPCRIFGEKNGIKDAVVSVRGYDSLLAFQERRMVQNQMNVVTINDPDTVNRQKAIMELIQLGSDLAAAPTRIPTIHFGQWIMIDKDKRLLFLSNYDGSWENYIGDFVDRANVPVDAFWGGSIGWRPAGCRDIDFFKEGIRCHQTTASFYFSAYPQATVTNITKALKVSEGYRYNIDQRTAKKWLQLL